MYVCHILLYVILSSNIVRYPVNSVHFAISHCIPCPQPWTKGWSREKMAKHWPFDNVKIDWISRDITVNDADKYEVLGCIDLIDTWLLVSIESGVTH